MSAAAAVPLRRRILCAPDLELEPRQWNPFAKKQSNKSWTPNPDLYWQLVDQGKIRGDGQGILLQALAKDQYGWGEAKLQTWSEPLSDKHLAEKVAKFLGKDKWKGDLNELRLNRDDAVARGLLLVKGKPGKYEYHVWVDNWPHVKPVKDSPVLPVPRKPNGRAEQSDVTVEEPREEPSSGEANKKQKMVLEHHSGASKPIILKTRGEQKKLEFPRPVHEMRLESQLETPLAVEPRVEGTILFIRILDPSPPGAEAPAREARTGPVTSQELSIVTAAIAKFIPVDRDLTDCLIADCRKRRPDCTAEEIVHFIEVKGDVTKKATSTAGGLLRKAVANALEAGLDAYRARRAETRAPDGENEFTTWADEHYPSWRTDLDVNEEAGSRWEMERERKR